LLELGTGRMNDLIRSVDLKLARADSQVRTLADQISAWTSRNPITARVELRDQRLGFRLILQDFAETAPIDDWGLLIGECVHNLRSALDNLAFALARLRRDPPRNPGAIAFPIYQDRSQFKKHGLGKLDQMPAEAASLIERLQPFQRDMPEVEGTPDTDALVLLQGLNNADKHRVPSVVFVAPVEIGTSCAVKFSSDEDAAANVPPDVTVSLDPLQTGLVLVEHKTTRPIESVSANSQCKAVVFLETKQQRSHVAKTLNELSYYTALVVSHFRDFFK
jgi:hypothetical protein